MSIVLSWHGGWLSAADDPGDRCQFERITSHSPGRSASGDVRTTLSGSRRVIVTNAASKYRTLRYQIGWADRTQVRWLEDHVGQTVCVRDDRGRRFFAVYWDAPVDESTLENERGDADISFEQVTFDEAV